MIDKTLLSEEILNEILDNVSEVYDIKVVNNTVFWNNGYINEINIYELMYLAKEFLYTQTYDFETGKSLFHKQWGFVLSDDYGNTCIAGKVDTELEGVLKSVKWVRDNK